MNAPLHSTPSQRRAEWLRFGVGALLALAITLQVLPVRAAEPAAAVAATPGAMAPVPALLISYQVAPANRAALRKALEQSTRARLRKLQDSGEIAGYRLLFSRYAEADQWDALAVITFSGPAQAGRWAAVERETPAALDPAALALLSSVHSVPVEMARRREAAAAPHGVVLVIPYLSLVSPAEYLSYADGYVIPQFEGWMKEGVLAQYSFFSSLFPAARPWTHLILQDWRGDEALATRAAVVAKVRGRLKDVPSWKAISDSKAKLREEKAAVVADDISVATAP